MGVLCPKDCCKCSQISTDILQFPGKFSHNNQEPLPVSSLGEWEAKPVEVNHKNCVKACCVDGCHEILRFPKEVFVSPNLLPIPAIYACSTTKLRQKDLQRTKLKKIKIARNEKKRKSLQSKIKKMKTKERTQSMKSSVTSPQRKSIPFKHKLQKCTTVLIEQKGLQGGMDTNQSHIQTNNNTIVHLAETEHQTRIINTGTDCFMIAVLHLFRGTEYWSFMKKELLPVLENLDEYDERFVLCKALLNLFCNATNQPVTASRIRTLVANYSGNSHLDDGSQKDAEEFFRAMEQVISQELHCNIDYDDIRSKHWGIEKSMKMFLDNPPSGTCRRCDKYPSSVELPFLMLKLTLPDSTSSIDLKILMDNHFSEGIEKVTMKCSQCCPHQLSGITCPQTNFCAREGVNKTEIIRAPDYLMVQILRYKNNRKIQTKVKIEDDIELLDNVYEPVGFLNHIGTTIQHGHYVTHLKTEFGVWNIYNDDRIYRSSLKEANSNENYIVLFKKKNMNVIQQSSSNISQIEDSFVEEQQNQRAQDQSEVISNQSKPIKRKSTCNRNDATIQSKLIKNKEICLGCKKEFSNIILHFKGKTGQLCKLNYVNSESETLMEQEQDQYLKNQNKTSNPTNIKCKGCGKLFSKFLRHVNSKNFSNCRPKYSIDELNIYFDESKENLKKRKKNNSQTEKGKENLKKCQKTYFQTEKGKENLKKCQKTYSQTEKGKKNLKKCQKTYSQTEKGKSRQEKYLMKKIVQEIETDTGFNVICCYCNQYKSKNQCHKLTKLTEEQQVEYLNLVENLNMSKDKEFYICSYCVKKIQEGKAQKHFDKMDHHLADFPTQFLEKVNEKAKINEVISHNMEKLGIDDPINMNEKYKKELLKLNKLEDFILKIILPFIRVGHCKRGRYLMVKGNLILISNDINKSMSKILPNEQQLLPVSFKRKMQYKGAFLEEWIDIEKVKLYFQWFKENNQHYKDIDFSEEMIQNFEKETFEKASEFENTVNKINSDQQKETNQDDNIPSQLKDVYKDVQDEIYNSEDSDNDEDTSIFAHEKNVKMDQTSIFMDKYETDINLPTVANRLATIIIEFEQNKDIKKDLQDELLNEDSDVEYEDENEFQKTININNDLGIVICLEAINCITQENCLQQSQFLFDIIRDDFENCKHNHETKKLEIMYEACIRILEQIDKFCPPSDERRTICRMLNNYFDKVEKLMQNVKSFYTKKRQNFTCNICKIKLHLPSHSKQKRKSSKKDPTVSENIKKIQIAPGEFGTFKNWGEDIYLEEKCFPSLYPYGVGGYLSTNLANKDHVEGFAKYVRGRIMSADPKFRQDYIYLFFLLLVKELIQLKRCRTTYLRQARKMPNLTKEDLKNIDKKNLTRYNRSFEVFKTMRGTSMYYQNAKRNLMAILRQKGCPSVFMTVSCAEYQWMELVRQILETECKKEVPMSYVESLSDAERNHIISRNAVQSTVHFQKRVEKIFSILKYDDIFEGYTVKDYYYRIEFQARGAPHLHSLLWLQDSNDDPIPTFWSTLNLKKSTLPEDLIKLLDEQKQNDDQCENNICDEQTLEEKKNIISNIASKLVFGSIDDATCKIHRNSNNCNEHENCQDCIKIKERVEKFNQHYCTFSCYKKKKYIVVKENEGNGRFDGKINGPKLECKKCRYNIPFFPIDETIFLQGITKDTPKEIVIKMKCDLRKIRTFLLRQTNGYQNNSETWNNFKNLSFWEYLFELGMFEKDQDLNLYSDTEKNTARTRYINALTASIKGSGYVFLKRNPKDCFTNNFNPNLMLIHPANHDIQFVVDQYAAAQYICGYLCKNEAGMSQLLKNINDEAGDLSQMDLLKKLASVLDRHREVSIQEATYRMMGFPMTKSSVKVKYLATCHPHFRDGLLKSNIDELDENESIFHNSPHTYYENRPVITDTAYTTEFNSVELETDFWKNLPLSDFWSWYEVISGNSKNNIRLKGSHKLLNGKGFIRRRKKQAVLRYYLPYENNEEYCRALLTLFYPFRNEMNEIHTKDVQKLLLENSSKIMETKALYEEHLVMTEIISDLQKMNKEQEDSHATDSEEDIIETDMFTETTEDNEIKNFEKWAKNQAESHLKTVKEYTNVQEISIIRRTITGLNDEQRLIFDDIMEQEACPDDEKTTYYLYIFGPAGTGKSYLMRLMMEAIKIVNIKSGNDLNKPSIISMAPTANAAYIVGAKTIDSAMCFSRDKNYVKLSGSKEANMKFLYEDVKTVFIDEISMTGSSKFTKIHLRMQDLADGHNKHEFFGAKNCVVTGDFYQLPPVKDRYVFENNNLDGRPDCAPSHWDENFSIYCLTKKVRSEKDPKFGEVCDRIGTGNILPEDETYLKGMIRESPRENNNESFKNGKISVIVTTNKKREKINHEKLNQLLPHQPIVTCNSKDKSTNISNPPELTDDLNYTATGNLQKHLQLKIGAPIMLTVNNMKTKYKEDGICNGVRAYIDSFQFSEDSSEVFYIWIVFKNEKIGQILRNDNKHLLKFHKPTHPKAVPIQVAKQRFNIKGGNVSYQRTQFPAVLCYAVTSHRSQGQTLDEVVIDFSGEGTEKPFIVEGSFYVAITRATCANDVYLKAFDKSYIKVHKPIVHKLETMKKFKNYKFKKIYLNDNIFIEKYKELKLGYININDLTADFHAEYVNGDKNLNNLDILIIADTRLTNQFDEIKLQDKLSNFLILKRYDSNDSMIHMGLLVLATKKTKFHLNDIIFDTFSETECDITYLQGVTLWFEILQMKIACLYIRRTPTENDIKKIKNHCQDVTAIFGDLNLNPKKKNDNKKLETLCQEDYYLALNEITTTNFIQLDHIIMKKAIKDRVFATSYFNFITDHKSITARIGFHGNSFTDEFLKKRFCNKSGNVVQDPEEDINCHICQLPIERNDVEVIICYCNTKVHNDCHKSDGDSCSFYQS